MKNEIIYKVAIKKDYTRILELYNQAYNTSRKISDLEWLYDHNPMGKGVLFIAIRNGNVIGMQGLVKYSFVKNGNLIDTYKSEDSLVASEYRGQGIYKRLYKMVFDHAKDNLVWGLTDKKTIFLRAGMPSDVRFSLLIATNGFLPYKMFRNSERSMIKAIIYNALSLSSTLRINKIKTNDENTTREIRELSKIKTFGDRLSVQYPTILFPLLTADILKWRLDQNSKILDWYIYALFDAQKNIMGISIVTTNGKKARWLSTYFDQRVSPKDSKSHVISVRNKLNQMGVRLIDMWAFDNNPYSTSIKQTLVSGGFRKISGGLWIVNNSHRSNQNVNDILFSAQLGLD